MTGCNKAWVKSARRRNRVTACKKVVGRAERGRKVGGLVKAADRGLTGSQERAKAGQVVRVAVVKQVLEVRAAPEVKVDKAVPVAGKGPGSAVLARAEVVVVEKNKCGPAGAK